MATSKRPRKSPYILLEREVIKSKALRKLSANAIRVYLLFLNRRVYGKIKGKAVHVNNGEIIFTYREAKKKFGLSQSVFARAITQLVECGFIDISHQGKGWQGDCSEYAISERWRDYGTDKFIFKTRKKDTRGLGITKNNWWERSGSKRKNLILKRGITTDTLISTTDDTCDPNRGHTPSTTNDTLDIDVSFFIHKGLDVFKAMTASSITSDTIL